MGDDRAELRYQPEEANCGRQERGNLEMGQNATPSDLIDAGMSPPSPQRTGDRCREADVRPSVDPLAMPATTPCARASSQPWNANCWHAAGLPHWPRRAIFRYIESWNNPARRAGRDGQAVVVDRHGAGNRGLRSGEWAGEEHRGNAARVKGETTYVGSRGPRGKHTNGVFHPRLLKRADVFCKGEGDHSDHAREKGGNWVYHCVKPE